MFLQKIKMMILSLMGLLRRALCCFSRKRTPSFTEPMTNVIIVDNDNYNRNNNELKSPHPIENCKGAVERDWNSWDDSPRTIQEHIEQYRQKVAKPESPLIETPEPDYFKELTPVIQPQPKFYLKEDLNGSHFNKANFSRLEAKTDVPIALTADLEDWIDNADSGWEEMDTKEAKNVIREQRRKMRNNQNRSKIDFTNQTSNDEMNCMTNISINNGNNNNKTNNNNNIYAIKQAS